MRDTEEFRWNYGDHAMFVTFNDGLFHVRVWAFAKYGNTSANPRFVETKLGSCLDYVAAKNVGFEFILKLLEEEDESSAGS